MRKLTASPVPVTQLLAAALLALLAAGCTYTRSDLIKGTVTRISILQKVDIPKLSALTTNNVLVTLEGYANDGGSGTAAAVTEAAVKAGISAAAKGLTP